MSIEIHWQHATCGHFGRFLGPRCEGCKAKYRIAEVRDVDVYALKALAHNLAIAGGLCAAFGAGGVAPRLIPFGPGYIDEVTWRPGCGRTAPGWEVSRCGR